MNRNKLQDSLLMGALASSFGIFISKVLGLFYYTPLSEMAGEANMGFYAFAYNYYATLLDISSAGIPFAIAALVAKYMAKKDYKTVLMVRTLGISVVLVLSLVIGMIFAIAAMPLSKQLLGASAPIADITNLRNLFYILTIAIIAVPFLSSIRGYAQGLKRLDIYGASQVLEQLVRVLTIIFGAYIVVRVMNLESISAIYVAVAAAAFGAIVAIVFTKFFSRKDEKHVYELAEQQDFAPEKTNKEIIKEILSIGIPYLIISFLGSAGPLINTTFFMDYMDKVNGPAAYETAKLSFGILQANIAKISNIPSVLALGFGSGMVPYLSESLEQNDNHKITKQINQILDTVCIILVPTIVIFIFFAKDIYFIMYGNNNLDLSSKLFAVSSIQIFLGTIAPVFSSIMMSLKLRKEAIISLIISFVIKLIAFFPCVKAFGAYGMIYSSGLYYLAEILIQYYCLRVKFNIDVRGASKRLIMISLSSLLMVLPALLIHGLINFNYTDRIYDILIMGGLGVIMLGIYYFVTKKLGLLAKIFDLKEVSLMKVLRKYRS